jgi:hypothetical protein
MKTPLVAAKAQAIYDTWRRAHHGRIVVRELCRAERASVAAPPTLNELIARLGEDWAIPVGESGVPLRTLFARIADESPLISRPSEVHDQNFATLCLAYAFLSERSDRQHVVASIEHALGAEAKLWLDSADFSVTWSSDAAMLRVHGTAGIKDIAVTHPAARAKRKTLPPNSVAAAAPMPRPLADLRLADNALGKIECCIVLRTPQVTRRCLAALVAAMPSVYFFIVVSEENEITRACDREIARIAGDTSLPDGRKAVEEAAKAFLQPNQLPSVHANSDLLSLLSKLSATDERRLKGHAAQTYLQRWRDLRTALAELQAIDEIDVLHREMDEMAIDSSAWQAIAVPSIESRWTRDYFLIGQKSPDKAIFLESTCPLLPVNRGLAESLARHPALASFTGRQTIDIPFEGGDFRAVGDFVFVGGRTFDNACKRLMSDAAAKPALAHESQEGRDDIWRLTLKRAVQELAQREVIVVGDGLSTPLPPGHIDTYLTFIPRTGFERPSVVIADTNLSVELFLAIDDGDWTVMEWEIAKASLDPRDLTDISSVAPYRATYMDHDLLVILAHGGFRRFAKAFVASAQRIELQRRLEALAKWFREHGFEVIPAPALLLAPGDLGIFVDRCGHALARTIQDRTQRLLNNGLVESYCDESGAWHRKVYLPHYGITPIESKLKQIYADLGYEAVFIPFMWEAAWGGGGIDCLTSEIRIPMRRDKL